jgi:predicted PurR-regulated permease PerM
VSETRDAAAAADDSTAAVGSFLSSPVHVRNIAFTLLSIAIVVLLLQLMQSVLLPLVLGALLFYALDPAVDWLQKLRVPRAIGAALMLFIVVSGCGGLTYSLQEQALTVIDELPAGARKAGRLASQTPWRQARGLGESATGCGHAPSVGETCVGPLRRHARAG